MIIFITIVHIEYYGHECLEKNLFIYLVRYIGVLYIIIIRHYISSLKSKYYNIYIVIIRNFFTHNAYLYCDN